MTVSRDGRRAALRVWLSIPALACALLLFGCGSSAKDDLSTRPLDQLYAEAREDMTNGGYDRARKTLERVEGRATGTMLAQQALLDLAYVHYKMGERTSAIATLDRFAKLHPSSPALDYALYLRGMVYFNDDLGLFAGWAGERLSERDQQASRDSHQAFKQLVDQFPNSSYAPDARLRMDYIVNALANYEVHVARYYYRRGAYVAAANRAQQALQEFPRTPATEEALFLMARSYEQLGLTALSQDAERVLDTNFPSSIYKTQGGPQRARAWWQLW